MPSSLLATTPLDGVRPAPVAGHPVALPLGEAPLPELPLAELIGAAEMVPVVNGQRVRYVNMDYAASAPALRTVAGLVEQVLPLYASVHRGAGTRPRPARPPTRRPGGTSPRSSARAATT